MNPNAPDGALETTMEGDVVNAHWAALIAATFRDSCVRKGVNVARAEKLYESFYQGLMSGDSPEDVEKTLFKDVQREERASKLDQIGMELLGKFRHLPKSRIQEVFEPARAYLEEHPTVPFSEVLRPLKDSLWAEGRVSKSPMAAAMKKAGIA